MNKKLLLKIIVSLIFWQFVFSMIAEAITESNCVLQTSANFDEAVKTALKDEIPKAKLNLQESKLSPFLYQLESNPELIALAVANLKIASKGGAESSAGLILIENKIGVSVSAIKSDRKDPGKALEMDIPKGFKGIVDHFWAQADELESKKGTKIQGFIHLIFVLDEENDLSAMVGISDSKTEVFVPRQIKGIIHQTKTTVKPRRCDVDTEGLIIQPGEGYLLTPQQVSKSPKYWESLDVRTRAILRESIKYDASPWLVSEKHIHKFDVNKHEARKKAIEFWQSLGWEKQ